MESNSKFRYLFVIILSRQTLNIPDLQFLSTFLCRIIGDNWDLEVKARYQTKSQNNKSLHYFHAYAVKDRVSAQGLDNTGPQKRIDEIEMQEFLPTTEVQEAIASDLVNIVPRVLVKYLTLYSTFKKAVIYHIPHAHTKEMVEQSEVVCFDRFKPSFLVVLFK